MQAPEPTDTSTFGWMSRHPIIVIASSLIVTAILSIPFLALAPTTSASQEPGGAVFEARDAIEERFVSAVVDMTVIVESREGDILARESLIELRDNSVALRADPVIGPTLLAYYDPATASDVVGVRTVADLVEAALPAGLDGATDADVDGAVAQLVEQYGPASPELAMSIGAFYDESANRWVSPAITAVVLSDNKILGFTVVGVTLGTDTAPEEYSRTALALFRGDETTYQAWGIAIDVNLTAQEQGEAAGPFVGLTILAVLIVVGIVYRSYWALAIVGAALGAMIVWLYGISNLLGLENDLILSLIVPIAMISFGVDFAFHSLGRYREERRLGLKPRRAFAVGLAAVIGALTLALLSDMAAFISNASSGIESLIQFGVATSIALVAAFLLLGIVTPLALGIIEERVGTPPQGRIRTIGRIAAQVGAGMFAMTTVLLMVFIYPPAGLGALFIYIGLFIVLPAVLSKRRELTDPDVGAKTNGRVSKMLGRSVAWLASKKYLVLPIAGIVTIGATFLALQVPTEFDVKDFFAADADFVVSLDKVEEHLGDRGGERASIYVEADLTNPQVVARLDLFRSELLALGSDVLARADDGETFVFGSVLGVIEDVWISPVSAVAIAQATGVELTDSNQDGIPDTADQLSAIYAYTREAGVRIDATRLLRTPDDVRQRIWVSDDGAETATTFTIALLNTRRQESVIAARAAVEPSIERLEADLVELGGPSIVVLTGGPIVRQVGLEAVSKALQLSLPIAVVLCFLIAAVFMHSVRFAFVSVIPILITVSLLYGFMEIAGYSINIVTATIGAVSIGIGIDYAIHLTMRFREEMERGGTRNDAMRRTGEGTGIALLSSAVSSAVGFFILAFAPMPLFASYGLLTAVMITMAAAATLLVLPSLLMIVTKEPTPG